MKDTPKAIIRKQFEIIQAIPLQTRVANMFELTELSRTLIANRIREENPGISGIDLKVELFRRFYKSDFDPETLEKIAVRMKYFLESGPADQP